MNLKTLVFGLTVVMFASAPVALADDTEAAKKERELLFQELESLKSKIGQSQSSGGQTAPAPGLRLGGYGEIHFNTVEDGDSFSDIHRFVVFAGYTFSDWVQFFSETELEHAFAGAGQGGEFKNEQFYMEFNLCEAINLRIGRIIAPLGYMNEIHEPPTFNGVKRPLFYQIIVPTTWTLEGGGTAGQIGPKLSYQLYFTNSINGALFSETSGIRGGRLHERPGNRQTAVTGKVTIRPQTNLEFGLGFFQGGVNNGNKGVNPGIDNGVKLTVLTAHANASFANLVDLKFAYGVNQIAEVEKLNDFFAAKCSADADCTNPVEIAEEMNGLMAEVGFHVLPESLKKGKLSESDLVLFYRLDQLDTQAKMAGGTTKNESAKRQEQTVGLSFLPVPRVSVKVDHQILAVDQDGVDDVKKYASSAESVGEVWLG